MLQLKLVVVETLGRMSYIMSRGKLEEQFPRLLPTILSLYRRNIEPYHITLVRYTYVKCTALFCLSVVIPAVLYSCLSGVTPAELCFPLVSCNS